MSIEFNFFALIRRDKASGGTEDWELAHHINDCPVLHAKREEIEAIGRDWSEHIDGDEYEYKAVPVVMTVLEGE